MKTTHEQRKQKIQDGNDSGGWSKMKKFYCKIFGHSKAPKEYLCGNKRGFYCAMCRCLIFKSSKYDPK